MGRQIGPRCKKCRRIGESVCGSQKCAIIKRNFPPGLHGANQFRRLSEFGLQLREKQKVKLIYGVQEKQFRNYYDKASSKHGNTGEELMLQLETRLDNAVFRAGFAETRRQARQLVTHGHFMVDGRRCDIPSRSLRIGEKIELREKSKKGKFYEEHAPYFKTYEAPKWLEVDKAKMSFAVAALPGKEDIQQNIAINLIVEFYSR